MFSCVDTYLHTGKNIKTHSPPIQMISGRQDGVYQPKKYGQTATPKQFSTIINVSPVFGIYQFVLFL